jgi:hypothetical protein
MNYKSEETYQRKLEALARGRSTRGKYARIDCENRKKIYYDNPKKCLQCNTLLNYTKRKNIFCSKSCAAKYNNKIPKRKKKIIEDTFCLYCGNIKNNRNSLYCSPKCARTHQNNKQYTKMKEGLISGTVSDMTARKWFRMISEHKCSICQITEWNNKPVPLVVDHIDGNSNNNYINNLRMICCNCDALLPTYRSRNKGRGRKNRKW